MEALYKILLQLNVGLVLIDLPTMAIFFYVCQRKGKINSSMITVLVALLSGFFMLGYETVIKAYAATLKTYSPAVDFFWYVGFACIYAATLFYLRKAHVLKNIRIGTLGLYINKAFTVAALLQLAQYTEILLLKTDQHLDKLYSYGMLAINITSTAVFFLFAVYSLYHTLSKTEMESLRWNI